MSRLGHRLLLLVWVVMAGAANGEIALAEIKKAKAGAWGEVEYFPLILEPPDIQITAIRAGILRQPKTIWKLAGLTKESAVTLFREAGVPAEAIEKLSRPPCLQTIEGVVTVFPPSDLLESLTPEVRSRLYPRIGTAGGKAVFTDFFALEREGFAAMAEGADLRQSSIELISRLTYPHAGLKVFSDIRLVMERAGDESEQRRILKTLLRERSLSVRLRLSERSDLAQLTDYWSARGRCKEILPILESITGTDGVERLDIAHLLPPTPRKLLHTYPDPRMATGKKLPDCYWTAFNFFSYEASNRHHDGAAFRMRLEERYESAARPLEYGDLMLVYDAASGSPHHACSFIADDIIFTKNGGELLRPWVLTRIEEVVGYYSRSAEVGVAFFRLKPEYRD